MNWVGVVYAVVLAVAGTAAAIFYIAEYTKRGGTRFAAFRGSIVCMSMCYPLALVSYLQARQLTWPNQLIWQIYGVGLIAYLLTVLYARNFAPIRENLRVKMREAPRIGLAILIAFAALLLPGVINLGVYMLK
jgi:hypothetical protein